VSDPQDDFDSWLGLALRRPVRVDSSSRARIMARVRAETPPGGAPAPAARAGRPRAASRRGWVAGHAGGLLAAGLAGILTLGLLDGLGAGRGGAARPVAATAIRDTLRLVRFVLAAPAASSVALVGDFNGWSRSATPLAADARGAWTAAVALAPGRHRYAFVVDDSQWVTDPAVPAVAADSGRPASAIFVTGVR
jgi:hypothetical protein